MPIIEIEIRNKIARQTNDVSYVCSNSGYSLEFDFDAEWDGYPLKTARFIYNGGYRELVFSGNECPVPVIEDTNYIEVGVYAGDLKATTPVPVEAKRSILCGDDIEHEAPPVDLYDQLMAQVNEEGKWIDKAKTQAQAAANAAEASAINAEASKSAAAQSEASAASKASAAASSAAAADTSAKAAAQSESSAANAASAAASSAAAAKSSAADASDKAAAAASSAAAADTSAKAAAQSEASAASKASAAASSAAAAASSANDAAQNATAAGNRASAAAQSEALAANAASAAASGAAAAKSSATDASNKASAAASSAAAAESSAKAAAQSETSAAQSAAGAASAASEAATEAANALLEEAKESGEFDGPAGKDGTSIFYSSATPGTVIGLLNSIDLSTIESNGRTVSAGDLILSAGGYIYQVRDNLGTTVQAYCMQRGVGVDGSSLFYSTMADEHYVGGSWGISLDTIDTMGRKISEGDLIFAANDFLYRVVSVRDTEVTGECLQRWSGIDGLCIYFTYSTPTQTSSGSRYYTISGGQIETFGRQFSVGDLIFAGDGELYRIETLLDQPPNYLYVEWLTRWRGRDGGIQTVNGIEPDANGNVEIVAGTQPDLNQNDPTALDYVKNRTHWEEISGAEILPECQPRYNSYDNVFWVDQTIEGVEAGNTYVVSWNGTEYECVATEISDLDVSATVLGDIYTYSDGSFGTAPTGEPFAIGIFSADTSASIGVGAQVKPFDGATELTLSIYSKINVVHKLPGKFLPDGVPYVEEGIVELPVTGQWYEEKNEDGTVDDSGYMVTAPIGLQIGSTYTVNWNGTDYEVTGQDYSVLSGGEIAGVSLGNLAAMGGDDTGEPFVMTEIPADLAAEMGGIYGMIMSLDLSINIPFAIYGEVATIQKIDPRCLPTGVPYIEGSDDFTATLLPETEAVLVDSTEGIWGIEAVPLLKIGETYLVNYNGTEYTCVAQDASAPADEAGSVGLGELSNLGGFGNGEPFVFFTRPSLGVSYLLNYSSSTVPTVSIYGKGVKVHKLDNRCLDLAWLPTVEKTDVEVQGETTFTKSMTNMEFQYDEFLVGAEVAVVFDGVRYECTVVKEGTTGALVIGNLSILSAELGSDTGEPFCIYSLGTNGYYVLVFADENEHTVAVYAVDAQYNVIPDGFLGEGRSRIFSLDDMGMPSVETDTTETITVDTSEIVNILISGGKVNLSFNCTLSAGAGSTIVSVSAVLDGTKTKLNYHWSSLHYAEDFCLYAFIVDVNDTTISVTNRKIA